MTCARGKSRALFGLVCLLFALPSVRALAQQARTSDVVQLSIADCAAIPASVLTKLVALELAPQLTIAAAQTAPSADTLRASLRCSELSAVITVYGPGDVRPLVLSLDLAETESAARPRLLALALAELVATRRLDANVQSMDERTPSVPLAPPAEPTVEARERRVALWLSAGVLRAFEPALWSPTVALGSGYGVGRWAANASLDVDWVEQRTSLAIVRARSLSLALAPALRLVRRRFGLQLGLGVRVGAAWFRAEPRTADLQGRSLSGALVAPIAQGALTLPGRSRWSARIGLELGYVVKPVRGLDAEGSVLLELGGVRVSASLGVAVAL